MTFDDYIKKLEAGMLPVRKGHIYIYIWVGGLGLLVRLNGVWGALQLDEIAIR